MWDALVREHVPMDLVERKNDSELAIYWKNGSIQRFVGCENPDAHRGINPIDVVFDEYSEMNEQIWTAIIQPVMRENKGRATFIFTYRGKNHAWKLINTMRDNPQWFTQELNVYQTDAINKDELDEARRTTPRALFEQEYECKAIDDAGSVFRNVRQKVWDGELQPNVRHAFQVGVDLAKYNDWTVLTPLDRNTFRVGKQDRFNQVEWNLQKARIATMAYKFLQAELHVDSTGIGDPICSDLVNMGLNVNPVEGFKFTETSRRQLLENLAIYIEQQKLWLPNDEELFKELESMRYVLSENVSLATGKPKIKMQVPDGMPDDRIMSLALAAWGLPVDPIGDVEGAEIGMYGTHFT